MHFSGGGGTPWMQPKSNVKSKLASSKLVKLLAADFGLKYFYVIVATVPTGLQTCAKMLQMRFSGGGGIPWLQPKSNVTFKLASINVVNFLADGFGFMYFHYSGHSAHTVANLCKNAVNALFKGWGDTLDATQK